MTGTVLKGGDNSNNMTSTTISNVPLLLIEKDVKRQRVFGLAVTTFHEVTDPPRSHIPPATMSLSPLTPIVLDGQDLALGALDAHSISLVVSRMAPPPPPQYPASERLPSSSPDDPVSTTESTAAAAAAGCRLGAPPPPSPAAEPPPSTTSLPPPPPLPPPTATAAEAAAAETTTTFAEPDLPSPLGAGPTSSRLGTAEAALAQAAAAAAAGARQDGGLDSGVPFDSWLKAAGGGEGETAAGGGGGWGTGSWEGKGGRMGMAIEEGEGAWPASLGSGGVTAAVRNK